MQHDGPSLGGDVLNYTFKSDALTFVVQCDSAVLDALLYNDSLKKLEHVHLNATNLGKEAIEKKITELELTEPTARWLAYQSDELPMVWFTVFNEDLREFCEAVSNLFCIPQISPFVKYMAIHPKFDPLPDTYDLSLIIASKTLMRHPEYFDLYGFGGKEKSTQLFNYPSHVEPEGADESTPTLYGVECAWKLLSFHKSDYISSFGAWWDFNSKILLANRLQDDKTEGQNDVSELLENISLNRSSIIELSWELDALRKQVERK